MRSLALLLASLLSASLPLVAQKEVGKFAEAEGDVREGRTCDEQDEVVAVGDPIRIPTCVGTGRRSRATLWFGQGMTIKMPPRDNFKITEEEIPEKPGEFRILIEQGLGATRIFIADLARGDLRVSTRDVSLGPKSTAFIVRVTPSRTLTWVLEGQVEATATVGGPPVLVQAGEMIVVRRGRQPTPPTPFDPDSGATASGALPPSFGDEEPDPPVFLVPDELPPRRGIDDVPLQGGFP